MGGFLELICMVSSTEGASPPEMMNWMHADFQIKAENGFSLIIEKNLACPGQYFISTQCTIVLPVQSGSPSIFPNFSLPEITAPVSLSYP